MASTGCRGGPSRANFPQIYLTGSWASPVVQTIKNQPAMQATWVQPLAWEDPLEKGMASEDTGALHLNRPMLGFHGGSDGK